MYSGDPHSVYRRLCREQRRLGLGSNSAAISATVRGGVYSLNLATHAWRIRVPQNSEISLGL